MLLKCRPPFPDLVRSLQAKQAPAPSLFARPPFLYFSGGKTYWHFPSGKLKLLSSICGRRARQTGDKTPPPRASHLSLPLSPDDVDVGEAEAVQRFSVISVITLSGNWVPLKMFNLRVAARKRRGATGDGGWRRWGES